MPPPPVASPAPPPSASASASAMSTVRSSLSPRLSAQSFLGSEPPTRTSASASTRASTWSACSRSRSRSRGSTAPSTTSPSLPPPWVTATEPSSPCPSGASAPHPVPAPPSPAPVTPAATLAPAPSSRNPSVRTARRDKRRSRSVSDILLRPSPEMGLGLSFHAPPVGSDYFTLGSPFPGMAHIHVSAHSLESAREQLAATPKPVTHLMLEGIENRGLSDLLQTHLPALAPSLLVLKISDCELSSLPPALALCGQLEELDMSRNPLVDLPVLLAELHNLRVLLADQLGLTTLPDWLGGLTQLKVLSVSHNRLTYLPPALHQLVNLERLILDHNPWSPAWAPVVAAVVHGPPEQSDLPLASQSSVALQSAYEDDDDDTNSPPSVAPSKTPPSILSALRHKRSLGEPQAGSKSSRSSLSLQGLGARRPSNVKGASQPATPTQGRSKSKGRHSLGSSDDNDKDRSKWSLSSLRRARGIKLEPPPLPFPFPRSLSGTMSSTPKPSGASTSDLTASASASTSATCLAPGATGPAVTTASAPLTPLDVRRFSGFNFWEELASNQAPTRLAQASPMSFRAALPDRGLARPLSFLPVAHTTPPIPIKGFNDSHHSHTPEEDDPWSHRQAVEHRVDIKHLLSYLRDMHQLQDAQSAFQKASAAAENPHPTPPEPKGPSTDEHDDLGALALGDEQRCDDPLLRRRIIEEVVASEESYVRGMQEFMDVYVAAAQQAEPPLTAPTIPLAEQHIAFGNLPALYHFHTNWFLPAIQEAGKALESDPTALEAAEKVADAFLRHSTFFTMYTAYINNCDVAQHLVALWDAQPVPSGVEACLAAMLHVPGSGGAPSPALAPSELASSLSAPSGDLSTPGSPIMSSIPASRTSSSFVPNSLTPLLTPGKSTRSTVLGKSARKARQKYLRKCAADPRRTHISIGSYLMLPVQRVPRYRLLLEALARVTPSSVFTSQAESMLSAKPPSPPSLPSPAAEPAAPQKGLPSGETALPRTSPRSSIVSTSEPWIAAAAALVSAFDSPDGLYLDLDRNLALGEPSHEDGALDGPETANHVAQQSRLDQALFQVRDLAHTINESKRSSEQARRLVEWAARILGTFPSPLVQPHRHLLRDGVVMLRKMARLGAEHRPGHPDAVPTLQQTFVDQPVVLLLCNDLAVFLQAQPESLHLLRAAGEDAAAHAAVTEAVASLPTPSGIAPGPPPPPPDSAGPLLQTTEIMFELFAVLRVDALMPAGAVERVDETTLRVMDHSKLFLLSAQSPGDADAWLAAFQRVLE